MWLLKTLPVGAVLFIAGCASLPADRGFGDVGSLVRDRSGLEPVAPGAEVRARSSGLLARPVTAETAVALALLRHPALRREYAELGISQSEVLDASRLSNPTLSVSVLDSSGGEGGRQVGVSLVQNFTDLLFLSTKSRLAGADLDRAKQRTAGRILDLASEVRQAYFQAVGASQVAQMRRVVAQAAMASGELARRFRDAGNISELEFQREQAAATQARLDAATAEAELASAKLELNLAMGLTAAEAGWTLDASIPLPVADETPLVELQKLASDRRLDLAAKRSEAAQLTEVRSLASKLRWLGVVEVGVEGEREADGTRSIGPTVSLQLPIFNQGQAAMARIDSLGELIQAELAALEAETGVQVASRYQAMDSARKRAELHRTELIPQREAIVARTQEMQNYMLVGQFELLVSKQEEYDAYQSYLEALRDYWIAREELVRAVGTRLPSDDRIGAARADAVTLPLHVAPMGMKHEGHSPGGDEQHSGHPGDAEPPSQRKKDSHDGHDGHGSPAVPKDIPEQPVIQEKPRAPHH